MLTLFRPTAVGASILFKNSSGNLGQLGFDSGGNLIVGQGTTTAGVADLLKITPAGVATFYNSVTATSFTGSLTGNADTASKAAQITVGSCTTAQATTAKAVTLANYTLEAGAKAIIKFTYAAVASSTLNINNTGAKNLYYNGALTTAST